MSDPEKRRQERTRKIRTYIGYALGGLLMFFAIQQLFQRSNALQSTVIPYSQFKLKLAAGEIESVMIGDTLLTGVMQGPQVITMTAGAESPLTSTVPFETAYVAGNDAGLVQELQRAGVQFGFQRPPSMIGGWLLTFGLPLLLIAGFWYAMSRRIGAGGAGGGIGSIFSVGKSKATEVKPEAIGVTYKDVGGADEAIAELQEIIQFLKTPEQFTALGGHIPKGVLLVGPPGTGKSQPAQYPNRQC